MCCLDDCDAMVADDELGGCGIDYRYVQSERSQELILFVSEDWMVAGRKVCSLVLREGIKDPGYARVSKEIFSGRQLLSDRFSEFEI